MIIMQTNIYINNMKKIFYLLSFFVVVVLSSCDKDYNELYSDNKPEIPVTFPGAITHGFNPYKSVALSGNGVIEFTLSIPENSGRAINEITTVVGGATGIQAGNLRNASFPKYISNPIPGNGANATFTTTLNEFASKSAANAALVKVGGELAFMFLIKLDNNQEIIPVQVRVRITE
jgi:hypothetical protein